MKPLRRAALVSATIDEIGARGSLDITVAQIARRAGVSSALAHHYFGGKEDIFLAAMRHVLRTYSGAVRDGLRPARGARERAAAIVAASFAEPNFTAGTVSAWLNFYVLALTSPPARRMLGIYQARLRSNLRHALRPALGPASAVAAERIAAQIDGLYLREGLAPQGPNGPRAEADCRAALEREMTQ